MTAFLLILLYAVLVALLVLWNYGAHRRHRATLHPPQPVRLVATPKRRPHDDQHPTVAR